MSNVGTVKTKAVVVTLDKKRNLLFDLNAFAELEEFYGNIDDALKQLEGGSMKALRAILWSGLVHEDPELTVKDVGSFMGLADIQKLSVEITQALMGALPTEKKETKKVKSLKKTTEKN